MRGAGPAAPYRLDSVAPSLRQDPVLAGRLAAGTTPVPPEGGPAVRLFPDLVYVATAPGPLHGAPPVSAQVSEVRLLALPRRAQTHPLDALRTLVHMIEEFVRATDRGQGEPDLESAIAHLFRGRFDPATAHGAQIGETGRPARDPLLVAESAGSARVEAVRQAQAAMSDMLERMVGDVRFDTRHLRAAIHLEPPMLGRLHIDLSIDDTDRVLARISADKADAEDFLRQNQEQLRQGLTQQGFQADQVQIEFVKDDATFETWLSEKTYAA
jgi:hypothetical protein